MRAVQSLGRHRRRAESRMGAINGASDGIVRRKTGRMVQNESTGLEVPEWADIHSGPFRLAGAERGSSGSRATQLPGGEIQTATRRADFPHAVTGLLDGDLIDVTAGENTGTVWKIVESDAADQQTARRLPVVSEQRPTEWP